MKNSKLMYSCSSILQIICAVLWFVPVIVYSGGYVNSYTGEANLVDEYSSISKIFEGAPIITVIIMSIFVLSLLMLVIPIIKNATEKSRKLIFSKICTIISLVFFSFLFFAQIISLMDYFDYGAICRLTVGGWLYIIAHIALIVVLFKISSKSKKSKHKEYKEPAE